MPELVQTNDAFLRAYDEARKALNDNAPPWLQELREKAIARYAEHGVPTTKVEAWRYTNLTSLQKTPFRHVTEADASGVTPEHLAPFTFRGLTGNRVVFVDGHFSRELSTLGDLPDGVTVKSLAQAIADGDKAVETHLGKYARFDAPEEAFTALNTAFAQDGAFVHVARNVVAEEPIHLLFVSTARGGPTASHPRNLLVFEESSQATVLESYFGLSDDAYLTNAVTEIVAGDNSSPSHYKIQRESEQAYHVGEVQIHEARDANVSTFAVNLGGAVVRNDVSAVLDAEGSHLDMDGLFAPRGTQHIDNFTRIDHAKPHCTSHELYKGILDGKSRGVFTGRIHVHQQAQKTDAIQHNPNLILTEGALVDSTPQLEIYADDVKCTHGSTIGQLDEESVFYLQSRGVDRETARTMLTYAFAGEVIDKVKLEPVREKLKELLLARLPNGELVRDIV